eukprot:TRINITY_DN1793_c0_g1_i14.p1 TRINITY_DN1793_c0_g1~~TRINITY_DN1793_c0_g1_i14.p1  ORF type:complete len:162 (+),score=14.73 TRINITY_DN1793_c0_g1_i14:116-601(+)
MIRRPPRSTLSSSSAASDVYKRQYQRRVRGLPFLQHPRCGRARFVVSAADLVWVVVKTIIKTMLGHRDLTPGIDLPNPDQPQVSGSLKPPSGHDATTCPDQVCRIFVSFWKKTRGNPQAHRPFVRRAHATFGIGRTCSRSRGWHPRSSSLDPATAHPSSHR